MTVDELLKRCGLQPQPADLASIRRALSDEIDKARDGPCDEALMQLCCVQLFASGLAEDALLIWGAKLSTFDMSVRIEIQLVCGAGLGETKSYLAASTAPGAAGLLAYIQECEATGDFEDWSPKRHLDFYRAEYGVA